MKILCDVDQVECIRHGVDAPSSTIKIEVDPKSLEERQRNFVADQIYDGLRFPKDQMFQIYPPTYEGFIAAVDYGVQYSTWTWDNNPETRELDAARAKELKEQRERDVNAAIKEMEKRKDGKDQASVPDAVTRAMLEKFRVNS